MLLCGTLTACGGGDDSTADASAVTNMSYMFWGGEAKQILLGSMDPSHVTTMVGMFNSCRKLETLDLSGMDATNFFDLSMMFDHCESLKEIIVSDQWKLYDMSKTYEPFTGCVNLVGGNGTKYDEANNSAEYARIDTPDTPGYLTAAS